MRRKFLLAVAAVTATSVTGASAQTAYPNKPVKIVVPFPAGGTTDIVARLVAVELQKTWGQPVEIENRAGAGGNIGADVAAVPNVMVIHHALPVNSVREFIAYAKANPGRINMASSGNGTSINLSGELFKSLTGVYMVHLPYRGSAPALQDLIAGNTQVMFDNLPSALPNIRSGRLTALAVTSRQRSAALPNVPTIEEAAGLKGLDATAWFGLPAPAGTPREAVNKVHQDVVKALAPAEMREKFAAQGAVPVGDTPEQFTAFIRREIDKWTRVVQFSGAKVD